MRQVKVWRCILLRDFNAQYQLVWLSPLTTVFCFKVTQKGRRTSLIAFFYKIIKLLHVGKFVHLVLTLWYLVTGNVTESQSGFIWTFGRSLSFCALRHKDMKRLHCCHKDAIVKNYRSISLWLGGKKVLWNQKYILSLPPEMLFIHLFFIFFWSAVEVGAFSWK